VAARQRCEVRVSSPAFQDIAAIWDWTVEHFGNAAALRYEALIEQAIADLAADPQRPGVKQRSDLLPGLWLYHLDSSRTNLPDGQMVKSPRHLLIFRHLRQDVIEVVRVLHDSRDLARHLAGS
jgi:toxin ParE1/3/4